MAKKVFVVTDVENGWDCVCGVYSTKAKAIKEGVFYGETPTKEEKAAFNRGESTRIIHEEYLD